MTEERLRVLQPAGFFVLRTPLLPFETASRLAGSDDIRALLSELLDDPIVRRALAVSARSADSVIGRWLSGAAQEAAADFAIVRYLLRMSTRPTPFGLSAGWSTGVIGTCSSFELSARCEYREILRPSVQSLIETLTTSTQEQCAKQRLRQNPSARVVGPFITYTVDRSRLEARRDIYASPAVVATLAVAGDGLERDALVSRLKERSRADLPESAIEAFIDGLVNAGALIPADGVLVTVPSDDNHNDAKGLIRAAANAEVPRTNLESPIHAELLKPATAVLSATTVNDLGVATEQLAIGARRQSERFIEAFKKSLRERWGEHDVPLLEAVDEERGVLANDGQGDRLWHGSPAVGVMEEILGEPLLGIVASQCRLPNNVVQLPVQSGGAELIDSLPEGLAVVASVGMAPDGRDVSVFRYAFGPSASRLLSRFCRSDARLREMMNTQLRQEEERLPKGVVCADVVYLPRSSAANAVVRPRLRKYEIVCRGSSCAPQEEQIWPSDLTVSLENNRLVLRSARLGCEVVPRSGTAFNTYRRESRLFRLLSAIAEQDGSESIYWRWGPLGALSSLPRVQIGNVVVSRSYWRLSSVDLDTSGRPHDSVQRLRDRLRLPRFVTITEQDRELFIDLDSRRLVSVLVDFLRRRGVAHLHEMLPQPADLCVVSPEGRFTNEIIVPYRRRAAEARSGIRPVTSPSLTKNRYALGSEWLYAKTYLAPRHANNVLVNRIGPLITELKSAGVIDSWFFVRYADPEHHLRVRCHGRSRELLSMALAQQSGAFAALQREGIVADVQWASYCPELKRYGGVAGIRIAEALANADSEMAVATLSHLDRQSVSDRWLWFAKTVHEYLEDYGMRLEDRLRLIAASRDAGMRGVARKRSMAQARNFFRERRETMRELLDCGAIDDDPISAAISKRSTISRPCMAELQALTRAGELSTSSEMFVASCIHMSLNRLMVRAAREIESTIYDLLVLHYKAEAARALSTKSTVRGDPESGRYG